MDNNFNNPIENTPQEVTFENTIKVGKEIMVDGQQFEISSVEHMLKGRPDGGYWEIRFSDREPFRVGIEEAKDWYILYQNGKK